jgi:uncharacterized protein YqgV (UPF0045/DUF77 family)
VEHRIHATGTNLQGSWQTVMDTIQYFTLCIDDTSECAKTAHAKGMKRILVNITIDSHNDHNLTIHDTIASVTQ